MTTHEADMYQHKLNEAKRLIDTHNYLRKPTRDDTRVVYSVFLQRLANMGGTSNEMLMQTTADDLEKVCGLPILMSRRLGEIFQNNTISSDIRAKKDWDLSRAMRSQMEEPDLKHYPSQYDSDPQVRLLESDLKDREEG